MIRRAFLYAMEHDALNLAQSAAYSAMVALFPALVVTAAAIALLPDVAPLKVGVGEFFDEVLPASTFTLLTGYFGSSPSGSQAGSQAHTIGSLLLAGVVSVTGASSVILTLMEGVRRAYGLPVGCWKRFQQRGRALVLVPVSLLPLVLATILVVFGQLLTEWLATYLAPAFEPTFFALALALRWIVSLTGVTGLTALLYHLGTPLKASWWRAVPGAVLATTMWFASTLVFGWYVTRFANYSLVYGSLGAGVALLFWLYLVFLSVLCGAEFNVQYLAAAASSGVQQGVEAKVASDG